MTDGLTGLTISNAPPTEPGMDYQRLKTEGIEQIAALASRHWTDYNAHDPGITILEILCYALTDLSYRLSFDIEDLLAYPTDAPLETRQQFFTAREILTVNPLTVNDYRKLLIDIDGVKNAWLEPLDNPAPALYTDKLHSNLSFETPELSEVVKLKGLYRVLIERETGYTDTQLIAAAKAKLYPHRNLCEDFAEIKVLALEEISVQADLEIADGVNPNELMAQIYAALEKFVAPDIEMRSLSDLLALGQPPETIFNGPALEHGFIDDAQLQQFERRRGLHASDFLHILLEMSGVKTVKQLTIASSQSPSPESWVLALNPNLTPRLQEVKDLVSHFTFSTGQITYSLDLAQVEQTLSAIATGSTPAIAGLNHALDLPVPQGEYRELADYPSIQNDFPLVYGIGDIGLPASASPERKAQAKQLQAYLMVFDQLMANACAQLDRAKDLFSFHNPGHQSYFSQSISAHPGAEALLNGDYAETLTDLLETEATARDRRNRFLDHLMAHFSETFTDEALLFPPAVLNTDADPDPGTLQSDILQKKVDFLTDYLQLSAGRGRAFNAAYDLNDPTSADNISGLKHRISRLLGLPPAQQFLASSNQIGFHIVEHILMRPRTKNSPGEAPGFLGFSKSITEFKASDVPGQVTCTSAGHRLKGGEAIEIFYSSYYTGSYTVIPRYLNDNTPVSSQEKINLEQSHLEQNRLEQNHLEQIDPDHFDITAEFYSEADGAAPDIGEWVSSDQPADPFSFQISLIIPTWPARFQDENFKRLFYDTLIAETPAHINVFLHWLDREAMREFETTYALWRQSLSTTTDTNVSDRTVMYRLLNFLNIGSSSIPSLPPILGYMSIGKDFKVY